MSSTEIDIEEKAQTALQEIKLYPVDKIFADPKFNTRSQEVKPIDVIGLAKSIKAHGLKQAIIIRPRRDSDPSWCEYVVVAGHHRLMAFKVNEDPMIPAVLEADKSEFEYRTINVIENLMRKQLNPLEEAICIEHYVEAGYGRDEIAEELNQSPGWVQIRMMILTFPQEIRDEVAKGVFVTEHIRELYSLKDRPEEQLIVARKIKQKRESGEKVVISQILKKPPKATAKKVRKPAEVKELMNKYREVFGRFDIATRLLAWTIGEINNAELHIAIKEEAELQGKTYVIPEMTF